MCAPGHPASSVVACCLRMSHKCLGSLRTIVNFLPGQSYGCTKMPKCS
eukprot:CAMPEP_0181225808 /NCGR_PEP_ID=MMETSP1096-20121128/31907_1 /TAXON_ID=156174 ORGANISM="Chrysochromulina ericina, Strain CCMP281" /NCGR_SAMPLE_ID=MMETSP1096 /ASSEMBLY_ACC=CAM_ASM_000453 /LENGTH=47 /DNA_ID= /DNA_START= /DNA_END= /DNA_ORIENTATION=